MFGHQDSSNNDAAAQPATPPSDGAADVVSHPATPQTYAPTADNSHTSNDGFIVTDVAPAAGAPAAPVSTQSPALDNGVDTAATPIADTDLLELKQAALHELTPLIDHLEQTAEEKFRTMMMMIQASDDQTLLAEAYHAAQSIEDKKARAQALLDVVNEINYFTQQHHDNTVQ